MAEVDTDAILDDRRERRRLPLVGLLLSAFYVGGVSSPLAFLWLVLGFFQQSREIRLSGKALQLQASEMRRSVDEHRRLAGGERAE